MLTGQEVSPAAAHALTGPMLLKSFSLKRLAYLGITIASDGLGGVR